MKFSHVKLDHAYRLPSYEQAQTEFSDDDSPEPLEMHYDAATDSLVFGRHGRGIPWHHVVSWIKADLDLVCTDCGKGGFSSEMAKAGHKRHCGAKKTKESA